MRKPDRIRFGVVDADMVGDDRCEYCGRKLDKTYVETVVLPFRAPRLLHPRALDGVFFNFCNYDHLAKWANRVHKGATK
jgi:hypothetical protein